MLKPILFNTEMVRAIRQYRKTETRRLIAPHYREDECGFQIVCNAHTGKFVRVEILGDCEECIRTLPPKYAPGDILWVRESWATATELQGISEGGYVYRADYLDAELQELKKKHFCWKPSIHMPKDAARTFLQVKEVWAERLQVINGAGIRAEGITIADEWWGIARAREEFKLLWDSTIPKDKLPTQGWAANPWVWAYRFERCDKPKGVG